MSAIRSYGCAALFLIAPLSAAAEGFDGKGALVCDLAAVGQCDGGAQCADVTFQQIDLPPVFEVDFSQKVLHSEDDRRTTPIEDVELSEQALLLQGRQNGRGWSIAIGRTDGRMTATIAEVAGAMVVSGACTPE